MKFNYDQARRIDSGGGLCGAVVRMGSLTLSIEVTLMGRGTFVRL